MFPEFLCEDLGLNLRHSIIRFKNFRIPTDFCAIYVDKNPKHLQEFAASMMRLIGRENQYALLRVSITGRIYIDLYSLIFSQSKRAA